MDPDATLPTNISDDRRVLELYEKDVLALRNLGSALAATLETESPDKAKLVKDKLQNLQDERKKWVEFDFVDTVVHANTIFETIDSLGREFQRDYEALSTREWYTNIPPPSDLLYSLARKIERDEVLQRKAASLSGDLAITFIDRLTEVLDKHPREVGRSDVLKLLQRVVEASNQLPSQLWIPVITDMEYMDNKYGSEAVIFKCKYQGTAVAARRVFNSKSLQLIHREVIAHRELKHRNILPLLGVFKDDQYPLTIITPWMDNGESLDYLQTHPEDFLHIIQGLCAAVCYLHTSVPPIVHGDIKPSNLLIDKRGEPVLSDFGFSRIRHELTRTGSRSTGIGTLRYVAPEVFSSSNVFRGNVSTDIYASAVTIWSLASGEMPFPDVIDYAVIALISNGERPAMPTKFGTFQGDSEPGKFIWGLLNQMWHASPKERPHMSLVNNELERIRNDGSVLMIGNVDDAYSTLSFSEASGPAPSPTHSDSSFTAAFSRPIGTDASHANVSRPTSPRIADSMPPPSTGPSRPHGISSLFNSLPSMPTWASDTMLPPIRRAADTYIDSYRPVPPLSTPVSPGPSNSVPALRGTPSPTAARKTPVQQLQEIVDKSKAVLSWEETSTSDGGPWTSTVVLDGRRVAFATGSGSTKSDSRHRAAGIALQQRLNGIALPLSHHTSNSSVPRSTVITVQPGSNFVEQLNILASRRDLVISWEDKEHPTQSLPTGNFISTVFANGVKKGTGQGQGKKKSRNLAAQLALRSLG